MKCDKCKDGIITDNKYCPYCAGSGIRIHGIDKLADKAMRDNIKRSFTGNIMIFH